MENICVSVSSGELFIGVSANVFIGLVNYVDWAKTRKMSTLNFILMGLAISRIILLWIITSMTVLIAFYFKDGDNTKLEFMGILWYLSSLSSAWFDACLNVFLFLKIANFSHPIFLWLKWRVDKVILRILMGCFVISLLICLPLTGKLPSIYFADRNKTMTENFQEETYSFVGLIIFFVGNIFPFILCLLSCFLLVLSLWKHTHQMQLNVTGSRDSSTKTHVKAMKFMSSFIFLFILYHMSIITAVLSFSKLNSNLGTMVAMIIMAIYPLAHSIILILENSKLREAFLSMLWKLKCCHGSSNKLLGA